MQSYESLLNRNVIAGARRDEQGLYWITGRTDDLLNVSGHLLSTAEVEAALASHSACAEAAAVAAPHPVKGECLHCFVVLTKVSSSFIFNNLS